MSKFYRAQTWLTGSIAPLNACNGHCEVDPIWIKVGLVTDLLNKDEFNVLVHCSFLVFSLQSLVLSFCL